MQTNMISNQRKSTGFSLVEMAIVLVILGLLLGGAMALIGPQREVQKIKDTEAEIQRIQEALIAFAINNPNMNLPCPDNTQPGTGQEGARTGLDCDFQEGWVPFAILGGAGRQDAWGNRFRYRVIPSYSQTPPTPPLPRPYVIDTNIGASGLNPLDQTLFVCRSNAPTVCNLNNANVATNLVAVIVSHGRNGFGARTLETGALQTQPVAASVDEVENTNGRNPADTNDAGVPTNLIVRRFIARVPSPAGVPGGEFDDIVGWLPQGVLHSRLIAAGRLP